MLLLLLSLAWIIGIALGPLFGLPLWALSCSAVPLVFVPFFKSRRRQLLTAFPLLLLLLGGMAFAGPVEEKTGPGQLKYYNSSGSVTFEGMIADDPVVRDRSTTFRFEASSITGPAGNHLNHGELPGVVRKSGKKLICRSSGKVDFHSLRMGFQR